MAAKITRPTFTALSPSSNVLSKPCCLNTISRALTPANLSTGSRAFSTTPSLKTWIQPKYMEKHGKALKGRPQIRTGGSIKGTTLAFGDYGLRLKDHDRRISAAQLKIADDTIRRRLRGLKYRLYHRVVADTAVYTSGNDQRMGKGKGSFDYWATRCTVSKIVFELKGEVHEQVVRDAMRLAGNKLPGLWEFVKKGDPPVMGITKVGYRGLTEEFLKRPRKEVHKPNVSPNLTETAERLPASSPM
nr:54s ribosomal protein l16, mitochondrial [Quercus suber]